MHKGYIKIWVKGILLLLPLLLLLGFYLITDPFKVIYKYDSYYASGMAPIVILNKDYVSTETFLNSYNKRNYDSYIFGSSRSMFYQSKDWEPYIHSDKIYHFDAWKESLYGIYLKCKLLEQKQLPIHHVLLVLDTSILETTENTYHEANLYMKHPLLSGDNKLYFQYQFAKAFFDVKFCIPYIDYKLSGRLKPYMRALDVFEERPMEYDARANEVSMSGVEALIDTGGDRYYNERKNNFYRQADVERYSVPVIHAKQQAVLQEISDILSKKHSDCRVIISPHYLYNKLNPADLAILQNVFGKENVFDFSGKNWITTDKHNFYDMGHYRPRVAKYILSMVYGEHKGL